MNEYTMFDKIMKLIDEQFLENSIKETESDRWYKSFKTRDHLGIMIFAQIMGSRSLRDLCIQFNSMNNKAYFKTSRSTISDANTNRDSEVFGDICADLIAKQAPKIAGFLRVLDSSPVLVAGKGSEWTLKSSTRHIHGLKIHVRLEPDNSNIDQFQITLPNVNDICVAKTWDIIPETINIFDKGYFDFNWWHKIHEAKAFFVTRLKKNTAYIIEKENELPLSTMPEILNDQHIKLKHKTPRGGKVNLLASITLRLIKYRDPVNNKDFYFVSNDLMSTAEDIAQFYKIRWDVELFFKWIKQNLKIKTFLGQSENAIKIQIYTAVIAFLLLQQLRQQVQTTHTRLKDFFSWVKIMVCKPLKYLVFDPYSNFSVKSNLQSFYKE